MSFSLLDSFADEQFPLESLKTCRGDVHLITLFPLSTYIKSLFAIFHVTDFNFLSGLSNVKTPVKKVSMWHSQLRLLIGEVCRSDL